jgi:hypothetical protein
MEQITYRNARDYAPIDVRKGIDLITKKIVSADALAPKGYKPLSKCRICKNYQPDDEFTGVCNASAHEPKFMAYADMCAVTCEKFVA